MSWIDKQRTTISSCVKNVAFVSIPWFFGMDSVQGNDAMDMFIDPLSVFGSERHPALQEVLKQIDKTKKSRGEYLRKMRELQGD